MWKLVVAVAALAGLGALVVRRRVGRDIGERIAAMPDSSPPKWMFMNVKAIRENTDRILQLLLEDRAPAEPREAGVRS